MDFRNGKTSSARTNKSEQKQATSLKPVVHADGILPIYLGADVDDGSIVPTDAQSLPLKLPEMSEHLEILVLKDGVSVEQNKMGTFNFVAPPVKDINSIAEENIRKLFQVLMDHVVARINEAEKEAYEWIYENPNLVPGAVVDSSLVLFPGFVASPLLSGGNLGSYRPLTAVQSESNGSFGNAAIGELIQDLQVIAAGGPGLPTIHNILTATSCVEIHRYGLDKIQALIANVTMGDDLPTSDEDWQPDVWALDGWLDDEEKPWMAENEVDLSDDDPLVEPDNYLSVIEGELVLKEDRKVQEDDVDYDLTLLYGNGESSQMQKQLSEGNATTQEPDPATLLKWD